MVQWHEIKINNKMVIPFCYSFFAEAKNDFLNKRTYILPVGYLTCSAK